MFVIARHSQAPLDEEGGQEVGAGGEPRPELHLGQVFRVGAKREEDLVQLPLEI